MQKSGRLFGPITDRWSRLIKEGGFVKDAAQLRAVAIVDEALPGLILRAKSHTASQPMKERVTKAHTQICPQPTLDEERVAEYTRRLNIENRAMLQAQQARHRAGMLGVPRTTPVHAPAVDSHTQVNASYVQAETKPVPAETQSTTVHASAVQARTTHVPSVDAPATPVHAPSIDAPTNAHAQFTKSVLPTSPGLYLFGSVGRGKTVLMDLLVDFLRSAGVAVDRVHFTEFMKRAHTHEPVCTDQTRVLCIDEVSITDVQDAAVFPQLLTRVFDSGVAVVATSNQHPQALYSAGLNRHIFLPRMLEALKAGCRLVSLDGPDMRVESTRPGWTFTEPKTSENSPSTQTHKIALSPTRFFKVSGHANQTHYNTSIESLISLEFSEADYWEIVAYFKSRGLGLELKLPPPFAPNDILNRARRFCKLVEILYDAQIPVRFVCNEEKGLHQLFANIQTSEGLKASGVLGETAQAAASPLAASAVDEGIRSIDRVVSRLRQATSETSITGEPSDTSEAGVTNKARLGS